MRREDDEGLIARHVDAIGVLLGRERVVALLCLGRDRRPYYICPAKNRGALEEAVGPLVRPDHVDTLT